MLYTPMTEKAMKLAYRAHHGQTDKAGLPYIFHPARVASGFTDEAGACAAWLHDVAEDTPVTLEEIRRMGFPAATCEALALLTHDDAVPYMDYVKRLAANDVARAVKLADLRDNMDVTRLPVWDEAARERVEKYRRAYRYLSGREEETL